jgi:hypothetical protein
MVVSARVGTIADLTALQRPPRRADDRKVLVENFPVALGVCLGVIAAVAAVFVFSMPMVRSPIDEAMLGSAPVRQYTAPRVRRAFAARGLPLPAASTANAGVTLSGSDPRLYVFVARQELDSAPRDPSAYERLVGNVLVHYGGDDAGVLVRVKAAVAALRG